jgi:TRAP-type C4-dicarboxylate transport system permease small subunit
VRGHETLDVSGTQQPRLELSKYIPEKQQDYVRLIVTIGLLLMFAWVIVWASIESTSWKDHWDQTKDMLQIILPALTGLIGSVLGFYFGSRGTSKTS